MKKESVAYNVRVYEVDGKLFFDDNCFAHRLSKNGEWKTASKTFRDKISKTINK